MCKWPEWDSHTEILKCQPHWNVSRILSAQPLLTPALTKEYQFYPLNLSPNWFSLSMLISLGDLHSRDSMKDERLTKDLTIKLLDLQQICSNLMKMTHKNELN